MFNGQAREVPKLPNLTLGALAEIQQFARVGLSRDEILDGFSLTWAELNKAEQKIFTEHFNYGRVQGIYQMSESLFSQAKGKGGTPAAMAFLARFSRQWTKEDENAMNEKAFNFNIKL